MAILDVLARLPSHTSLVATTPPAHGQPITLTARVMQTPGDVALSVNPTGTVTFKDGDVILKTVPLQGGEASAVITGLAAGGHNIRAVYNGDANYSASDSSTPLTVPPPPFIPPAVQAVQTSPTPAVAPTPGKRVRRRRKGKHHPGKHPPIPKG